jgi:hypothetical protein
VLTFILGPILALLPKAWRNSLPGGEAVNWRVATVLSGFAESAIALVAMMYWYSYSMTTWVDRGLDSATTGKMPTQVTDQEIGFTALVLVATHPLTWLLAYAGIEGAIRLVAAAFAGTNLGILPFFILRKFLAIGSGERRPRAAQAAGYSQGNLSSYVGAIREKAMVRGLPEAPDELVFIGKPPEEFLEIRSCRRKEGWEPPRTVRYLDTYFRLESCSGGGASRPFRYMLRKLSAGVMGRTVLVYSPEEPLVRRNT